MREKKEGGREGVRAGATHLSLDVLALALLVPPRLALPLLVEHVLLLELAALALDEGAPLLLCVAERLEVALVAELVDGVALAVVVEHELGRVALGRQHGLLGLAHLELALRDERRRGERRLVERVVDALERDEVVVVAAWCRCCGADEARLALGALALALVVVRAVVDELGVVVREHRLRLAREHAVVLGLDLVVLRAGESEGAARRVSRTR